MDQIINIFFRWSLRAAAQAISYEIPLTLCVLSISLRLSNSLSTVDIVEAQSKYGFWGWNLWRQPIGFIIFLISSLAECERLPFDLPEAEEELIAGYQTEYSGIKFGLFFMLLLSKSINFLIICNSSILRRLEYFYYYIYIYAGAILKDQIFGTTIGIFITLAKTYLFLFIFYRNQMDFT
uniref:NADH-plastoquinone oxidoreductase subunit 1 n=1 Tax=Brassica campestris TaxID=3711 RepID=A0A3P6E051_BRACM|nr:unnamed protein product [Brassica rapa]